MLGSLSTYIANTAHNQSRTLNIYELVDLWPTVNSGRDWIATKAGFRFATAACAAFIVIGIAMTVTNPAHSMSEELSSDQLAGPAITLVFIAALCANFWQHHFIKTKLEIIAEAKAALAVDQNLHHQYLDCVERAGAVAEAHFRAETAAQEARNAQLHGAAMQAQIRAANAQETAAKQDAASRMSVSERERLASSVRHNTKMAEQARRKGYSAGDFEGRAAADAARLASGRK